MFAYLKMQNYKTFNFENYCTTFCQSINSYLNVDFEEQNYIIVAWKLGYICYIYFGIVINLDHKFWLTVKQVLKICRITLPLHPRGVILWISVNNIENQNTVNSFYYFEYFSSILCIVSNLLNTFSLFNINYSKKYRYLFRNQKRNI